MTPNEGIEARLRDAANELRANFRLKASERRQTIHRARP